MHGSDGCCGLTFGHSPGLSGRGRKRQQEEGPPRIAGTSFSAASGCPDDCTRGSQCLPYGSAVPHPAPRSSDSIPDGITVLATTSSPGSGAEHTLPHLLLLQHFSAPGHCQSAVQVVPHGASGVSSASGQMPGFSGDRRQRGWEYRQQQRVFPTQSQSPWSQGSPLPASGTLRWGQADIVTATEAALLPVGTLSIVPAPGSAVVTGEQPGTGWAESILPCRYGVGWLQCHCLEPQPWGPGHVGCRTFGVAPSPLTLAVCPTVPAAQLVTAHVGWGAVPVLDASPLVLQWPLSDWGRAGVLCTVEQDESMMWPHQRLVALSPSLSTPVPTWGLCSVSPPRTRQSPHWQTRGEGSRSVPQLCAMAAVTPGITPGL